MESRKEQGKEDDLSYSQEGYSYDSGSDFYLAIRQKSMDEIMALFDELMETIQVVNPRLYTSVMKKL